MIEANYDNHMDIIEAKIRKVLYRMVEDKAHDYPKNVFKGALDKVIQSQLEQERIDEDGAKRLKDFAAMLIDEHCPDDEKDE